MTDFKALLQSLDQNGVEYIVAGGAAAIAPGSARYTQDLLGEICGGGIRRSVSESVELQMFSGVSRRLNLDQLIRAKRAGGRPKDLEALAELEALLEESGSTHE